MAAVADAGAVVNRAAELGPSQFAWWKDWRGQSCAIVASGPSAKTAGLEALRGRIPVIAIKECAVDLCPWADVAYGCDGAWWIHRRGLPDFKGVKICWERDIPLAFPDVHAIHIDSVPPNTNNYLNRILTDEPGVIGAGHNSGFQAINLAVQFGAARILLIGFDMKGEHYYGRNTWFKANNPDIYQFERSVRVLEANAKLLRHDLGVDIVNASFDSAVRCFRFGSIEQTLRAWSR